MEHAPATTKAAVGLVVLLVSAALYGALFNRETVLSYSIGYNLHAAERVLDGQVPYRDFLTLYPPGTVYLNAAIFNESEIGLYPALLAVCVFKILAAVALFLCAARLMPVNWALLATLSTLVWLRPNGPFKAVPMHYGALFLAIALYLFLRFCESRGRWTLAFAGASLAALALFKHNIGAYALAGLLVAGFVASREGRGSRELAPWKISAWLLVGFFAVLLPALLPTVMAGALEPMVRTLLFGPGEFLLGRLAAAPSPLIPLMLLAALGGSFFVALRIERASSTGVLLVALMGGVLLVLAGRQSWLDSLVFYTPVVVLVGTAWGVTRLPSGQRAALLATSFAAAAAFLEAFPRFAREQAIAAMPFVIVALCAVLAREHRLIQKRLNPAPAQIALLALPLIVFAMGSRLFAGTYFTPAFHLRSDTELGAQRGKGVYFPGDRAAEIDSVVRHIQQRVPEGGYFFAHSYAGSAYLFLADRSNPTEVQFWGGVGVTDEQRKAALDSLEEEEVALVITSDRDLEAEGYAPMRDYLATRFSEATRFGETVLLERIDRGAEHEEPR